MTAMATLPTNALSDPSGSVRITFSSLDPAPHLQFGLQSSEAGAIFPWWVPAVETRLQQLVSLEDNWNSHGARPTLPSSMLLAVRVIASLVGNQPGRPLPQIVPTRDGGLQLEWHLPEAQIEISIDLADAVWAYVTDDNGVDDGALTDKETAVLRILDQAAG